MRNKTIKYNSSYKVPSFLIFGFASIIIIILVIAIVGIFRNLTLTSQLELVVNQYNQHIKLVRDMRVSARERITMLYSAVNTDDEFDRDDYIQNFWRYGEKFLSSRKLLLSKKLSMDERDVLEKHRIMAKEFAPPQREVIAMIEKGLIAEARQFLVSNVEPNQAKALKLLDDYLNILHQLSEDSLDSTRQNSEKTMYLLGFLALSGAIVSIIIAIIVSTRLRNMLVSETQAKQIAEQANQAKGDFLANISHELRTPMNAILGFNHVILEMNLDKHQLKYQKKISSAAQGLLVIINNLLDFTQIDASGFMLNEQDFSLIELLNGLYKSVQPQLKNKHVDFKINVDSQIASNLYRDTEKLQKILFNLCDNAIKFTSSGTVQLSINLISSIDEDILQLEFKVEDTGIGISVEQSSTLFQSFSQVDTSKTRKYNGLGMGLVVAQKLVKSLRGKLEFSSELAQGSQFNFIIPLKENTHQLFEAKDITALYKDSASGNHIKKESNNLHSIDFNQEFAINLLSQLKEMLEDDDPESSEIIEELVLMYTGRSEYERLLKVSNLLDEYMFDEALNELVDINLGKNIDAK